LFLLVERRYPLSRFTLEQLVNVTRLQVEEETEMSLELLRKGGEGSGEYVGRQESGGKWDSGVAGNGGKQGEHVQ
nr:hypothetical protein [Tanacetum cinerariifolium]